MQSRQILLQVKVFCSLISQIWYFTSLESLSRLKPEKWLNSYVDKLRKRFKQKRKYEALFLKKLFCKFFWQIYFLKAQFLYKTLKLQDSIFMVTWVIMQLDRQIKLQNTFCLHKILALLKVSMFCFQLGNFYI